MMKGIKNGSHDEKTKPVGERQLCRKSGCINPVFIEPRTGIAHDFCGRTHAKEVLGSLLPTHGSCYKCNLSGCEKTVYFEAETGRVHDFCCKRHYTKALKIGAWPHPMSRNMSLKGCAYPGCLKSCHYDTFTSRAYDFCGLTHATHFKQLLNGRCLLCLEVLATEAEMKDKDIWVSHCNHIFHSSCIQNWLNKSSECPMCRQKL